MTTKDEALQMAMALEALNCIDDDDGDDRGHRCWQCDDYDTESVNRRRTDTTEHDLQHEYDKYRRAEMMQSYGDSERQIKPC